MHINSIFQCFRGNCRIYVQNVGDVCVFFVLGFFGELFSGYILRFEFEHNLTCENILGYFLYVFFGYILWFENEQKKQFKKCAYKRLRVFFFGENFRVQNFFEIQPTICLYILSTIVKFRASFLGNLGTKKIFGKIKNRESSQLSNFSQLGKIFGTYKIIFKIATNFIQKRESQTQIIQQHIYCVVQVHFIRFFQYENSTQNMFYIILKFISC
eukprot:TRINITY_DN3586_c0_g1_i1.p2 TRINITY_DN3586_c0_g1~~TRINITY_DN3586_c0_g1_i1.p2  ORF type:complete len:213 (-),score=2.62 TRINITY_DN3586_c0_g1_i1:743-1381(-)